MSRTRKIQLTRGLFATVDARDYEWLNSVKWHAGRMCAGSDNFYARRTVRTSKGKKAILMHRIVIGCLDGWQVDHIDGNGLNNTRANLRVCESMENRRNRRKHKRGSSVFKGVFYDKSRQKWVSRIRVDAKCIFLGSFASEQEAALAYDRASVECHGEFGATNESLGLL